MPQHDAFTRREFLGGGLAMVSLASTVPAFLSQSAQVMAGSASPSLSSQPGVPEDRILVIVQLSGGNDGLNTLVPYGMREYYDARKWIAVPESDVIKLDAKQGIGLHNEMGPLKAMFDEGLVSIAQGVGYPNPNRSHFTSMDIWHTADTRGGRGLGWIGRALDERRSQQGGELDASACVCIGKSAPLAAQGRIVKPVAFERANLFRWIGGELHPALAEGYDTVNRAGELGAATADQTVFVMRTALDAQIAGDRIRSAVGKGTLTAFPDGRLANQLRMVAQMIRAELPTRVYYVDLGGFDTHANQPGGHGRLLREFSTAMRSFCDELAAMGQQSRVLSLAFSEFGRRVEQNASNGTDHGTAGPVFLFGDMVRPGLLGTHPSLAADKLDNGDLVHNVDFRSIYASVLEGWMKLDSRKVLGQAFQQAVVLDPRHVG